MSRSPVIVSLALMLLTAACNQPEEGTTIAINADGGAMTGGIDGRTGALKVDIPGFKGELALPRMTLNADNFDMNGVHLYPGSSIQGMNIQGGDGKGNEGVRLSFTSPATPQVVRDWFVARMEKTGFTVAADGNSLRGTTDDKKAFTLDLAPEGADKARGTLVVGG
ncbi:hypothetical protein ASE75_02275 [Sphingomonas sp. Leaf17]|uniref:hypothetical protein n=1 Tax=Sphingomonas sp. Leaf17 TaxID=1735683 RepID=UPI0006F45A9A|nr:hypothetical protein [Sphingomonas sp. Leaf17]KQM67756.1 hypothetical protein ASE75_02275 [Sphingomonas sp. Leaf17]